MVALAGLFHPAGLLGLPRMLRKRRGALRYSDLSFLRQAPNPGRWLKAVPALLYAVALVFMVIALARPQQGRQYH